MSYTLSRGSRRLLLGDYGGYTPSREVRDWVNRVLEYTSSAPSIRTQAAMDGFLTELDNAGLRSKIISANCFVPDGLSASAVPIIRGTSYDRWKYFNYTDSDLTLNGIKGNSTNKYIDTGIHPASTFVSGSRCGITLYCPHWNNTNVTSSTQFDCLAYDAGNYQIALLLGWTGRMYYDAFSFTKSHILIKNPYFRGYVCANYSGSGYPDGNLGKMYGANPLVGHSLIGTTASFESNPTFVTRPLYIAAANYEAGPASFCSRSYSFFAVHYPLTEAESFAFYTAIQNTRTALGGGYVRPDPVDDWVHRVVYNGGAEPSANTQTALRTFYNGLVSNNLLHKMKVINAIVPDNLSASLTPFWNMSGSYDPWINVGFTSAQLSVNGLTGSGTSYLNTGFTPSFSYLTSSDAGLTIYVYNSTAQYQEATIACQNSAAAIISLYAGFSNVIYFDSYSQTPGAGRISGSSPQFEGYLSGNHGENLGDGYTTLVFTGSSANGHGTFLSSSTNNGGTMPTRQLTAFAWNNNGTVANHSRCGMSFIAMHSGLTAAESANFYTLVQQLRTDLGGGYV